MAGGFGRATGRLALGMAVFNPFLIWYAQDAGVYTLLICLVLGALWHTWQAARARQGKPVLRHWLAAGVLWWAALFSHYFDAFPLMCTGVALLLGPRTRQRWRQAGAMTAGVGIAYLPWAIYAGPGLLQQTIDWQPQNAVGRLLVAYSVGTADAGAEPWLQWLGGSLLAFLLIATRLFTITIMAPYPLRHPHPTTLTELVFPPLKPNFGNYARRTTIFAFCSRPAHYMTRRALWRTG